MPESAEKPVAVRAVAFIGISRWRHRPERRVRHDAYWADGRVDFDVSLSKMMYRGYPADFAPIENAVHEHCPEFGVGHWVDEFARVVDGPRPPEPTPPVGGWGRPREYRPTKKAPTAGGRLARRLGASVIGLAAGVFVLRVSDGQGFPGMLGALVVLFSLAPLLSLLLPARRRS